MLAAAALGALAAPPGAGRSAVRAVRYLPVHAEPQLNGPLMPTWDTRGTYGGWTYLPVMCDPATYQCQQYVPSP